MKLIHIINEQKGERKMKKKLGMIFAALLLVVLTACGTSDEDTNEQTDNTDDEVNMEDEPEQSDQTDDTDDEATEDQESSDPADDESIEEDDKNTKMKELEFAEFELEVEYDDDKEYEAEIEKKPSGEYKSELEDELTNTHLKGDEAFDHIYPILEKLSFGKDAPMDEVIDETLQAFELDANYDEFEIEVTFHDGTELEYEDK